MTRRVAGPPCLRRVAPKPRRSLKKVVSLSLLALLAMVVTAPAAMADAAGPTNYRTDIVSVEPATSAVRVEIIGGDAFLSLEQLEPVEIIVLGYKSEPYLRFDPDGTVYENRRSPAVWLNQDRYGNEGLPDFADPAARPEWYQVADNGSYAWHDHRSHWMNSQPPPSAQAGDQVLEASVPIDVDGERVTIIVASYLLDSPSVVPSAAGIALGLGAAVAGWRLTQSKRAAIGLLAAALAAILGTVAFLSVPAETGPSQLLWLLPTAAVIATLVQLLIRNRTATTVYLDGLTAVAGATLGAWGIVRFDALRRALIPTEAPASLDRLIIGLALVIGAALAVQGLYGLVRPERLHSAKVST